MRAAIRAELMAIAPLDALEQEHLADALAWLGSGAELCRLAKPATPPCTPGTQHTQFGKDIADYLCDDVSLDGLS